jgi:hypothetical protein
MSWRKTYAFPDAGAADFISEFGIAGGRIAWINAKSGSGGNHWYIGDYVDGGAWSEIARPGSTSGLGYATLAVIAGDTPVSGVYSMARLSDADPTQHLWFYQWSSGVWVDIGETLRPAETVYHMYVWGGHYILLHGKGAGFTPGHVLYYDIDTSTFGFTPVGDTNIITHLGTLSMCVDRNQSTVWWLPNTGNGNLYAYDDIFSATPTAYALPPGQPSGLTTFVVPGPCRSPSPGATANGAYVIGTAASGADAYATSWGPFAMAIPSPWDRPSLMQLFAPQWIQGTNGERGNLAYINGYHFASPDPVFAYNVWEFSCGGWKIGSL